MGSTAGLLFEHQMDLMTGHPTFEIFTGGDSESLHSFDQAVLEKLDRLECTIGLFGEDQGDVSQLALTAVQCVVAEIQDDDRGARQDCRCDERAGEDEHSDGTGPSTVRNGGYADNRPVADGLCIQASLPTLPSSPSANRRAVHAKYLVSLHRQVNPVEAAVKKRDLGDSEVKNSLIISTLSSNRRDHPKPLIAEDNCVPGGQERGQGRGEAFGSQKRDARMRIVATI